MFCNYVRFFYLDLEYNNITIDFIYYVAWDSTLRLTQLNIAVNYEYHFVSIKLLQNKIESLIILWLALVKKFVNGLRIRALHNDTYHNKIIWCRRFTLQNTSLCLSSILSSSFAFRHALDNESQFIHKNNKKIQYFYEISYI